MQQYYHNKLYLLHGFLSLFSNNDIPHSNLDKFYYPLMYCINIIHCPHPLVEKLELLIGKIYSTPFFSCFPYTFHSKVIGKSHGLRVLDETSQLASFRPMWLPLIITSHLCIDLLLIEQHLIKSRSLSCHILLPQSCRSCPFFYDIVQRQEKDYRRV